MRVCAFVNGEIPEKSTITISSINEDGKKEQEKILVLRSESTDGDLVHQQAVRQLIGNLSAGKNKLQVNEPTVGKKEEIIQLSLKYQVLSKFTTFLAIEQRDTKSESSMELREIPMEFSVGLDAIKKISHPQRQYLNYDIEQRNVAEEDYFVPNAISLAPSQITYESNACCSVPSFSLFSSSSAPSAAPAPAPRQQRNDTANDNKESQLIRLQEFDGHWENSTELERICGVSIAK